MRTVGIAEIRGRVAYRLDMAESLTLVREGPEGALNIEETVLSEQDPIRRVQQIAGLGVQTLVCGAVSGFVHRMFQHRGIQVIGWVIGDTHEVLQSYRRGTLSDGAVLHAPRKKGK